MGLASLTKLVSYKLNKRPCLRKVKWKGSEGKTTDVSFCHTHIVVHTCNHVHTKVSCGGWAQVETVHKAWSQVPLFIFTLLTQLSIATALTLDLWKQWWRRQGQSTYYLCVCFRFPACLRSGQPPVAPGSFGGLFSFAGQPLRGQRCSFPHIA